MIFTITVVLLFQLISPILFLAALLNGFSFSNTLFSALIRHFRMLSQPMLIIVTNIKKIIM